MNPRINQEQAGDFTPLPTEVITGPLAKYLSYYDLKKLRATCRFFTFNNPEMNRIIKEKGKSFKIAGNLHHTFMLEEGEAYVIGVADHKESTFYFPPKRLRLSDGRLIAEIITSKTFAILLDDLGYCYAFGSNTNNYTGVNFPHLKFLFEPTPILFPGKVQPKMTKVVASESHIIFITGQGKCYAVGYNTQGQCGTFPGIHASHLRPCQIILANNKPIVHAVVSDAVTFLQDNDGQWYQCGSSRFNFTFVREAGLSYEPTPITFGSGHKIVNIVVSGNSLCLLDETGQWFLSTTRGISKYPLIPARLPKEASGNAIIKIVISPDNWNKSEICYVQDNTGAWYHSEMSSRCTHDAKYQTFTAMQFPTHKKITHLIPGSSAHIFYGDEEGTWYGQGKNIHGLLLGMKDRKEVKDITPIHFRALTPDQPELKAPVPK